jgi:transcriptional regulator
VYVPRHFALSDLAQIEAFVAAAASADLVTFDGVKPVASLLPVIWDRPAAGAGGTGPAGEPGEPGRPEGTAAPDGPGGRNGAAGPGDSPAQNGAAGPDLGRLVGHLALANEQWQTIQPGSQALAIVHGPQAYISPSWYESKARHGRVVPTWNYESVHLTGTLTVHRDAEWLRALVTRLTRLHEGGRQHPWAVTDAPPDFINGQLRAIVGVELTITSVEAKRKLSQNRGLADQHGTIAGLRGDPGPGPEAIADHMAARLAEAEPAPPAS